MKGKETLNTWSLWEYVKHTAMILMKLPLWGGQLLFFWLPLKKNRITVYSMKQHGYSCNLKYLTEYLLNDKPGKFEILWIVKRREDADALNRQGIPVALAHSWQHTLWRMKSGIVITNDEFYPMFRKRRGQQYVNTWHGGINYKKIGYEGLEFTNPIQRLIFQMNNPCPDCFVSGSRSFTQTASDSFRFPKSVFLECGLPRNDLLCRHADLTKAAEIRKALCISAGQRAVLYAPTFRKGGHAPVSALDYRELMRQLKARFGGDWVVLLRQHYFVEEAADCLPECVRDVSRYEDMQELLLVSDCLISDYSSCMWDYLLTGRPCFVYAPDLAAYRDEDRSFFIPPETWPYPISTDADGLYRQIISFDEKTYRARAQQHREACGSRDAGRACRELGSVLEAYLK